MKILGALLLAGLLVGGGYRWADHRWETRLSFLQDSLRVADSTIVELREDSTRFAQQHAVDTVTAIQFVTRWKTLRETVHDTLTDTLTMERVVYLADSTIEACTVAWRGCEALRANAEARAQQYSVKIDGLTRQLARPKPLWSKPGLTVPLGILLGGAAVVLIR